MFHILTERQEVIEMSASNIPSAEQTYYNEGQLQDEATGSQQVSDDRAATEGQVAYEVVDDASGQAANYDYVNPGQDNIYDEITNTDEAYYRSPELSRQVNYQELGRLRSEGLDLHYQTLNNTQHIYERKTQN